MNAQDLLPVLDALSRNQLDKANAALRALLSGTPSPAGQAAIREMAALDSEVEAARALVEEAVKRRSARLREIATTYGAGPYQVRGQRVEIAHRGETYFLRALPRDGYGSSSLPAQSAPGIVKSGAGVP